MMGIIAIVVVGLFFILACSADETLATVYLDPSTDKFTVVYGIADKKKGVAFGSYEKTLNQTGWDVLNIETNNIKGVPDRDKYYAAGLLEGALTSNAIYDNSLNMHDTFWGDPLAPAPQDLIDFFNDQTNWVNKMIQNNSKDPFWIHMDLIMSQFNGLVDGYATTSSPPLLLSDFQIINGVGDLLDLLNVLEDRRTGVKFDWLKLTKEEIELKIYRRSLCSAIVKLTGNYSDLFASHSSWFTYSAMYRIYKHYNFNPTDSSIAAKRMSFSSYPGMLESLDDFYMMDSGLVMIQTTNSIFNNSLYDLVTPNSLFAWQRVRLANALSHTGGEWANYLTQYNSGTYNNQYMVINYNLFTPGVPLVPGTLVVVEQIPGLVVSGDITKELERGYFASYNVPYFDKIYNMSGYPAIVAQYGYEQSYQLAPRAKIFRRDQTSVTDLSSLKALMRQNNYQSDPYAEGSPRKAICSRGDLANPPSLGGCYDTKVTSSFLVPTLTSEAINGPTTDSGSLAPFSWTSEFDSTSHFGQPATFGFDFVQMQPRAF